MPSRCLRHLLLLTLTLALGLAGSGPAAAATFVVDNCTDTPSAGTLTLRQAVTMAGASGDTTDLITFVAGSCIIPLAGAADDDLNASGDIDILAAKTLTLQGSGPGITVVDGSAVDRVFDTAAGVILIIRNMTIRNGDATQNILFSRVGGAIFNGGTMTLEDVVVSGSRASQGGAIFNGAGASLTLARATINGNTVSAPGDGGGIFVAGGGTGTVTVTNSTISTNTGTGDGGGISTLAGSTVQLTNVTITGNTANRGGGIDNSGTMTLLNTIVAGNTGTTSNTDCIGVLTTQGNNLFGSNTECSGNLGGITTDIASATPGLGPLADNGGPTPTHALLATSPALNAGASAGCPATDQRVILRPARGVASAATAVCDIGAFELVLVQASLALSLNQTTFTTGQTLRANVTASNTGDAILVDVLFGIVVPASAAASLGCPAGVAPIAFITQVLPTAVVAFRCSNASLATFPTLLADNTLQPTPQFTVANFFSVAFPAATPRGSYLLFLAIVRAGSLDDGTLDAGDVIASSVVVFVVQ